MLSLKPLLAAGVVSAVVGVAAAHAPWPAATAADSASGGQAPIQAQAGVTAVPSQSLATASNVGVSCEPTQRAVITQTTVNGEPRVNVNCVSAVVTGIPAQNLWSPTLAAPMPGTPGVQPAFYPATYVTSAGQGSALTTIPRTASAHVAHRSAKKKTSWQTHAMVIGGSAGAGAGIGALIGGGKGALIGAAIGGGGSALYESLK